MKNDGSAEDTIKGTGKRLRMLTRSVNLDDPESVKEYVANKHCKNSYRQNLVEAYDHYVRYNGLTWQKPYYERQSQPPYVPTTEEICLLIAGAGKRYSLILSVLRDTGMRPIELERTTLRWVDLNRGIISVEMAKGGEGRSLELKPRTLAMLKEYISKHNFGLDDRLFSKRKTMVRKFIKIRRRIAEKLKRPELLRITLYSFRHYFGTMTYYRTKDILYTQRQLGHRNIKNTLIYTHLVNFASEEYVSKVAQTLEEICGLIEAGFEYIAQKDGLMYFRKRK